MGCGVMKFQHPDVDFPVIGTAKGVVIVRPEALVRGPTLEQNSLQQTDANDDDSTSPSTTATPRRKRKGLEGELLDFLKEAKAATQRRREIHLQQMKTFQVSFLSFIDKQ